MWTGFYFGPTSCREAGHFKGGRANLSVTGLFSGGPLANRNDQSDNKEKLNG